MRTRTHTLTHMARQAPVYLFIWDGDVLQRTLSEQLIDGWVQFGPVHRPVLFCAHPIHDWTHTFNNIIHVNMSQQHWRISLEKSWIAWQNDDDGEKVMMMRDCDSTDIGHVTAVIFNVYYSNSRVFSEARAAACQSSEWSHDHNVWLLLNSRNLEAELSSSASDSQVSLLLESESTHTCARAHTHTPVSRHTHIIYRYTHIHRDEQTHTCAGERTARELWLWSSSSSTSSSSISSIWLE